MTSEFRKTSSLEPRSAMMSYSMFYAREDRVTHQAPVVDGDRREDRGPTMSWGLRMNLMDRKLVDGRETLAAAPNVTDNPLSPHHLNPHLLRIHVV